MFARGQTRPIPRGVSPVLPSLGVPLYLYLYAASVNTFLSDSNK